MYIQGTFLPLLTHVQANNSGRPPHTGAHTCNVMFEFMSTHEPPCMPPEAVEPTGCRSVIKLLPAVGILLINASYRNLTASCRNQCLGWL